MSADDEPADDRDQHHAPAEVVVGRRHEVAGEPPVESDVGDEADEPDQDLRHEPGGDGDQDRHAAQPGDPSVDGADLERHLRRIERGSQRGGDGEGPFD